MILIRTIVRCRMGIDLDRFVDNVKDGLLCPICRDVLEDPLQAPCEHVYCSTCIRGWLVHEGVCPEDRQLLRDSDLRPIFRYMRNDLQNLQIHCINHDNGCKVVESLETIAYHERHCGFGQIPCPNQQKGCREVLERHTLQTHLTTCEFQSSLCTQGCGFSVLDSELETHNCISELRTELDLLRSEMICNVGDVKQDVKVQLDSQRAYVMKQKHELQQQLEQLRGVTNQLQHEIRVLHALETKRMQDIQRMEINKDKLVRLLQSLRF